MIDGYIINRDGTIINPKTNRELKGWVDKGGYRRVELNQKMYFVHRLVAMEYLPNPDNLPQVNHKDENKLNNNVDNLEWCNNQYNCKYSHDIPIVCVETGIEYESATVAAEVMGLAGSSHITACCRGKRKTSAGYHWKYKTEGREL